MLQRLLEMLRSGGTRRITEMANDLQTTPEMVEAMLDQLTEMGYLRVIDSECSSSCNGCSLADLCASGASGRVWALTKSRG